MAQLNLSSEYKLLLYCARVNMSDDATDKIKEILKGDINWDNVIAHSAAQGISPLLYWNLSKVDSEKNVPVKVMADLRKIYYKNLSRNMVLYHELNNILKALTGAGISVIVLKGAFLAEVIYKNISLRRMSDIDLLIKEDDLPKAKIELAKLMYYPHIYPSELHEKLFTAWPEEVSYISRERNVGIDLHGRIQPLQDPFQMDINNIWENAKSHKIANIEALVLAPEDLLMHLCLHLYDHIHRDNQPAAALLRGYCDIAEVITHYGKLLNWSYISQSSKNYKIEELIYECLCIANRYFGAVVPKDFLSELQPIESSVNLESILELNIEKSKESMEIKFLKKLRRADGAQNRARILFSDVFPCKDFMVQRYHIDNKERIYKFYLIRFGTFIKSGFNVFWRSPHYIPKVWSRKI